MATGFSPCAVVRIGVWSGVKGGGCIGFTARGSQGVGFDVDLLVLGGGTVPTVDVLLRPSVVFPLAGTDPYFGLYGRVGATIIGASIPTSEGKGYARMGLSLGLGYDVALTEGIALRVFEASFYAEGQVALLAPLANTVRMDRLGHHWDIGLMATTGVSFH